MWGSLCLQPGHSVPLKIVCASGGFFGCQIAKVLLMIAKPVCQRNILVVDDEPLVCETIAMLLEFDGYHVDTVASGAAALAAFAPGRFDVVFTDYFMPAMTGGQLASALKALSPSQPVVMVTAFPEKLQARGQPPIDIDMFLGKPLEMEELRQAVVRFPCSAASVEAIAATPAIPL